MTLSPLPATTLAVWLLLSTGAIAKPQAEVPPPLSDRTAQAEAIVAPLAARYPALSVTVYKAGDIAWTRHSGYADAARTIPVGPDTRFNIYSTAKAITGLAYARLAERDGLDLDARVTGLEPGLPSRYDAVTLRHLLTHTSGVRHYRSPTDWLAFSDRRCDSPQAALDYFVGDELDFAPAARRQYSSFGFVVLSQLLVTIVGAPDFESALNRTLGPWAHFSLDHEGAAKAQPYVLASQSPDPLPGVDPESLIPFPNLSAECKFGAGGLLASSQELARVGAALSAGEIVPVERIAALLDTGQDSEDVAFGVAAGTTTTDAGTLTSVSQSGAAPGGRSFLLVLVEPRISVAITGNLDGPEFSEAAVALARLWL